MIILGFCGLGFMAYRRKSKLALMGALSTTIEFEFYSRPSAAFFFERHADSMITAIFEGLLGTPIVPILCRLYPLNRLVVRIGRWQIDRSEVGLSPITKHGLSLLALPIMVLLAMLQATRTAYCGGCGFRCLTRKRYSHQSQALETVLVGTSTVPAALD